MVQKMTQKQNILVAETKESDSEMQTIVKRTNKLVDELLRPLNIYSYWIRVLNVSYYTVDSLLYT